MTRNDALILMLSPALPLISATAETKKQIAFTDYMNNQYGVQHGNGPGNYSFNTGDVLQLVVTNGPRLAKSLGIRNLPNGEHILLQHIKDDRFELRHGPTGQKASVKLALK